MKKVKKYASGGLSEIADTAATLMEDVDNMANNINYGSSQSTGSSQPIGYMAISKMKKGGAVKSSASKRGDGIAQRGKTRGRLL